MPSGGISALFAAEGNAILSLRIAGAAAPHPTLPAGPCIQKGRLGGSCFVQTRRFERGAEPHGSAPRLPNKGNGGIVPEAPQERSESDAARVWPNFLPAFRLPQRDLCLERVPERGVLSAEGGWAPLSGAGGEARRPAFAETPRAPAKRGNQTPPKWPFGGPREPRAFPVRRRVPSVRRHLQPLCAPRDVLGNSAEPQPVTVYGGAAAGARCGASARPDAANGRPGQEAGSRPQPHAA